MNLVLKAKAKGKRGNIAGLAKHLAKRYGGDPHFFTKCTKAEELASYNSEQRNGICAKAHKLATGIWPGEHGGKNKSGPEKKEESLEEWLNVVRTAVENKLNASIDTKSQPSAQYNWVESTYPDGRVIVRKGEEFYMLSFDVDETGKIVVDDSNIIPVERGDWKPKITKECCGKRKMTVRLKGGAGSGNFGHSGRPGKVGGSASGGGGQATGGKWSESELGGAVFHTRTDHPKGKGGVIHHDKDGSNVTVTISDSNVSREISVGSLAEGKKLVNDYFSSAKGPESYGTSSLLELSAEE